MQRILRTFNIRGYERQVLWAGLRGVDSQHELCISLGQLHSDGAVVSIVRSSAGRLQLVYLSARRLRSSGYYPKYQNGALSSGF